IGSWDEMASLSPSRKDAIYRVSSFPAESNSKDAMPRVSSFTIESSNNYILSDIPVALCGVDDLMVIQKNGSLLTCKKSKGQLVKDAVELIKNQKRSDDLL
ncbi:MAG: hypothetical protein KAR21_00650, partial [Spirochaetales bacterium]|nr:hypothetical protein [Spirochaetales bacterium]